MSIHLLSIESALASESRRNLSEIKFNECISSLSTEGGAYVDLKGLAANIGARRFVGSKIGKSEIVQQMAKAQELFWWNSHFKIFKTAAEARQHADLLTRTMTQAFSIGFYIINEVETLSANPSEEGTKVSASDFISFLNSPNTRILELNYFDVNGNLHKSPQIERWVKASEIIERANFKDFPPMYFEGDVDSLDHDYILLEGWHYGQFGGVLDLFRYIKSSRIKKDLSLAKQIISEGYKIIFNTTDRDLIEQAIKLLTQTTRKKVDVDTGELRAKSTKKNRHVMAPHLIEKLRRELASGESFFSVVVDNLGNVVGAVPVNSRTFEGDSTAYDERFAVRFKLKTLIAPAQIAILPVFLEAVRRGYRYLGSGPMVTTFADTLGFKVVPRASAKAQVENRKQVQAMMESDSPSESLTVSQSEDFSGVNDLPKDVEFDPFNMGYYLGRVNLSELNSSEDAKWIQDLIFGQQLIKDLSKLSLHQNPIGRFVGRRPAITPGSVALAARLGNTSENRSVVNLRPGALQIVIAADDKIVDSQLERLSENTLVIIHEEAKFGWKYLKNPVDFLKWVLKQEEFPAPAEQRKGQSQKLIKMVYSYKAQERSDKSAIANQRRYYDLGTVQSVLGLDDHFDNVEGYSYDPNLDIVSLEISGWVK